MNRNSNLPKEFVVDTREVLEARPRSQPPEPTHTRDDDRDDDRWDNAPCTD